MTDYIFKVKNGLQVNTNLLYATGGQVGINQSSPDANLAVVGTANISGNVAMGGTLIVTGNTTYNANVTISATSALIANATPGSNGQVLVTNGSAIYWGTGTAGSNTQVQFNDSGTANGLAGFTFTKTANLLSIANTIQFGVGYGTTVNTGAVVNTTVIAIGNSSVNASVNSSLIQINGATIANSTGANNSFYFGGQLPAYYTNATNITTGTLPAAQLSGSYTSVTGVGALAAGSLTTGFTAVNIAQGGTGQATQQAALNALAGGTTAGSYIRGNGTNMVLSSLQATDVNTAINSATIYVAGVYAVSNTGTAIYGTSNSSSGVYGLSNTASGVTAQSVSGAGVYAVSNTGSGVYSVSNTGYGVYGQSNSQISILGISNTLHGVWGGAQQGGVGVLGISNTGQGVYAVSNTGTGLYVQSNTGIIATFNNATTTFAGIYANGNVGVGTTSPAYKIDVTGDIRASANVYGTNLNGAITSSQVTTALGYTPYNSTNPSSFANSTNSGGTNGAHTGSVTSSAVTTALGYTPYNSTNPLSFANSTNSGGTNGAHTGSVTSSAVTTALGYTPVQQGTGTSQGTNAVKIGWSSLGENKLRAQVDATDFGTNWPINISGLAATATSATSATTFTSTSQNSQFNSIGVGTAASGTAGEIRATNDITAYYSDKRLKENITTISNALAKVNQISGVTYNSNDLAEAFGYKNRNQQVGVIAQEIQTVLPQAVKPAPFDIAKADDGSEYSKSGEDYLTVQYEKLVPLLIEAIKELSARVEELENR